MGRNGKHQFRAMLGALAIDNFGSGLFLPVTLIYLTRVAEIELPLAGALLAAGTVAGILMPPLAARQVDRWNARTVAAASQVLQAAGMIALLLAGGVVPVLVGSVLVAAGTQIFYASLGTMTAEASSDEAKDRSFALVAMVRSAAFGLGGLAGGILVSLQDAVWLRIGVATNAVTFLAAAALLTILVHPHPRSTGSPNSVSAATGRILKDRSYLVLLATTFFVMLGIDLFMVVMPVYVANVLLAPGWVIGVNIAVVTLLGSTTATWAVRMTDRWRRTTVQSVAAVVLIIWSLGMAALTSVPSSLLVPFLVVLSIVFAVGSVLSGPRLSGILAALAPAERRGQYFAYFQYSFTAAQLVAPLMAGLLMVHAWLPWIVNAMALCCGLVLLWWLNSHLPPKALGGSAGTTEFETADTSVGGDPGPSKPVTATSFSAR